MWRPGLVPERLTRSNVIWYRSADKLCSCTRGLIHCLKTRTAYLLIDTHHFPTHAVILQIDLNKYNLWPCGKKEVKGQQGPCKAFYTKLHILKTSCTNYIFYELPMKDTCVVVYNLTITWLFIFLLGPTVKFIEQV